MQRASSSSSSLLLLLLLVAANQRCPSGLRIDAPRCDPSGHICEGRCPDPPPGSEETHDPDGGVCLRDVETGACVCWLRNASAAGRHLQTLFKCEVPLRNGTVRHVMCLPPIPCFPPDAEWGCMIVPHCACAAYGPATQGFRWQPVVAFLLRSRTPVQEEEEEKEEEASAGNPGKEEEDRHHRAFGLRHLLFLVAFVVAPLLCWCTLTFFRCRRQKNGTRRGEEEAGEEHQPLPTGEDRGRPPNPSAPPKPPPPPYEEASTIVHDLQMAPPPSYEDAVRDRLRWTSTEV